MRTLISSEIRKTAEFILFAVALNMEKNLLDRTIEELKDIINDKKNFDPVKPGLFFSPAGQKKVKGISPALIGKNFLEVIKVIDDAVKTNALRDQRFNNLNKSLDNLRKRNWLDLKLPGNYEDSKHKVITQILNPLEHHMSLMETSIPNLNRPRREIEEEHGVLRERRKELTPEDLAEAKRLHAIP